MSDNVTIEVTFETPPAIEVEFPAVVTVGATGLVRVYNTTTGTWFRLVCSGADIDPKFEWVPET